MSKRKRNALLCLTALIIGGLLYILFRPGTYIGGVLDRLLPVSTIRQICSTYTGDLFKFYLPDFLWAFSLGCCFIAINDPKITGVILCSLLAFLCGTAWEILQYFKLIQGTGDIHDVIMYFLASAICIIMNLKETKEK